MTNQDLDRRIAESTWRDTDEAKNWVWKIGDRLLKDDCYFARIINMQGDTLSTALYDSEGNFLGFGFDECTIRIYEDNITPIPNLEQMLDLIEAKGGECIPVQSALEYRAYFDFCNQFPIVMLRGHYEAAPTRREAVWKAFCHVYGIKEQSNA